MKHNDLFVFLENENYKLMLDIAKEKHTEEEIDSCKRRLQKIEIKPFFDVCYEHEFDGIVGSFALKNGIQLPDFWNIEYEKKKSRQELLKKKATLICKKLDSVGIPMVILKNGGIMIGMITDAVKCPMEDIDSLIQKKDFFKAHQVLEENGFVFKFRSDYEEDCLEEAFRHGSSEYYLEIDDDDKMWFELSWRVIDGRWIRPDKEPSTEEFIKRSQIVDGTRVRILAPEDNLLQVCIHTAKHSYCRAPGLRLHLDVDRVVAHNEIDWERFVKLVKKTNVCRSTYISLYIPKKLFNTDIPEWVLEELHSKHIDTLLKQLAKVGLPHPNENKFSKIQFLRFQTGLYDSKKDVWRTLYPNKQWMKERYGIKTNVQLVMAIINRGLDLVGFRKKK